MTRSASNDRRRPLPVTTTTTTYGDNDNISDSNNAAMTANTPVVITPGMNEDQEKFSSTDTSPAATTATATTTTTAAAATTSFAAPNTKDPPQQNDQQPGQVEEQKWTKTPNKDEDDKHEKKEEKDVVDNVTDEKGLLTCMVCWAASDGSVPSASSSSPTFITLPCNHSGCHSCIVCWIERCELNGLDEPTCPHCRQSIQPDVSTSILERPYQRMSQAPTTREDAMLIDDLTQDWLNDDQRHTHQCTNCGMYTIREEEDEDDGAPNLVSCGLCGHIYCWKCHCDYKQCYDRYMNNNNDDNDNDSSDEYDGDYESDHMDF